jgi:protein-L-isoaspartate(D-aspartate) O-methyltransferase
MDYARQRRQMVERQLIPRGIRDPRVLAAMFTLPRELFVPWEMRRWAYSDEPLRIGHDQTISQPYIAALMAQELELTGTEHVLEVGAGSGYHAALLASLARSVIAVELVEELAALASVNLAEAGIDVTVIVADGSQGYPERAPYDAISVAAAAPEIPSQLPAQLSEGGRLIIPVGTIDEQILVRVTRTGETCTRRSTCPCRFVPLRGSSGW